MTFPGKMTIVEAGRGDIVDDSENKQAVSALDKRRSVGGVGGFGGDDYDNRRVQGYYRKLRRKIDKWSKSGALEKRAGNWTDAFVQYLLVLPDLVALLLRMIVDSEIPKPFKGYILMLFAYLLSPIDIIPDFIPVAGFVDDLAVVALVLHKLMSEADAETLARIRGHWEGQEDVFMKIQEIVALVQKVSAFLPERLLHWLEPPREGGVMEGLRKRRWGKTEQERDEDAPRD